MKTHLKEENDISQTQKSASICTKPLTKLICKRTYFQLKQAWLYSLFGSLAWMKYLVGRTNEWVANRYLANPLGLRQTSALQIKTRSS